MDEFANMVRGGLTVGAAYAREARFEQEGQFLDALMTKLGIEDAPKDDIRTVRIDGARLSVITLPAEPETPEHLRPSAEVEEIETRFRGRDYRVTLSEGDPSVMADLSRYVRAALPLDENGTGADG